MTDTFLKKSFLQRERTVLQFTRHCLADLGDGVAAASACAVSVGCVRPQSVRTSYDNPIHPLHPPVCCVLVTTHLLGTKTKLGHGSCADEGGGLVSPVDGALQVVPATVSFPN